MSNDWRKQQKYRLNHESRVDLCFRWGLSLLPSFTILCATAAVWVA